MCKYSSLKKDLIKESIIVLKNEQHKLLEEQEYILKKTFETYYILDIPKGGISIEEQKYLSDILINIKNEVIFVSPIPFVLGKLCRKSNKNIYVFCNQKREKKENHKEVTFKIQEFGWELLKI